MGRCHIVRAKGGAERDRAASPAQLNRTAPIWYGVAQSQRHEANTQRLHAFFAGPMEWTPFDEDDAHVAGVVRAELETAGTPIGAYDVLLAGQARRRGATLVTANVGEFKRVGGLKWENWAVPRR